MWGSDERSPIRRRRGRSYLIMTVAVALLSILAWSSVADVDRVTRGNGKVIPSQQVQVIQSYEGGIVRRVLVHEGDVVQKDQVLVEIDHSSLVSEFKESRQKYYGLLARANRLKTEANGQTLSFPPEVTREAADVVVAETALYQSRRTGLDSELDIIKSQVDQKRHELDEARINSATAKRSLDSLRQEIGIVEPLVQKKIEPEIELLHLQRTANEQEGKRDAADASVSKLMAGLKELEGRGVSTLEKYRSDALSDLAKVTADLAELEQQLPALKDRVDRTELRSPVHGVVNRIHATTVGGVAQSGQPLVEIVPIDDTLLIEAKVKPEHIAFLRVGEPALVRLSAYDFARYGGLEGTLVNIGADAVKDTEDAKGAQSNYLIRIRTKENALHAGNETLEIIPGMVAEVDVMTGKRTVLHYLIDPVLRVREKAFED